MLTSTFARYPKKTSSPISRFARLQRTDRMGTILEQQIGVVSFCFLFPFFIGFLFLVLFCFILLFPLPS